MRPRTAETKSAAVDVQNRGGIFLDRRHRGDFHRHLRDEALFTNHTAAGRCETGQELDPSPLKCRSPPGAHDAAECAAQKPSDEEGFDPFKRTLTRVDFQGCHKLPAGPSGLWLNW